MATYLPNSADEGDNFEPEFSGNDGGDSFFGKPNEESRGPGSVLAAFESPAEGIENDEPEPLHFECVAMEWGKSFKCCLDHSLLADSSNEAGLAILELDRAPGWLTPSSPGTITWYQIEYEPTVPWDAEGRIYTNLFSDGTPVRVKGRPADNKLVARMRPGLILDELAQKTKIKDLSKFLSGIGLRSDGVAIYDVGQGAWQGVIDRRTGKPFLFVDVGGGVLYNRRTFPKKFERPHHAPIIILSHWDWDHWSSARRFPSLLKAHWIAPPVPKKPIQTRMALDIMRVGRLTILPLPPGQSVSAGCIRIERCTGVTENDRGLAVTVSSRQKNGRTCLLPGDAAYRYVPSVVTAGSSPFNAICMSHHGGRLHSKDYPKPKSRGIAVNSAGPGNTYKHPLFATLSAHKVAGWPLPIQTGTSGSRPCHIFLPWGKRPQLVHGSGALSGPSMTV